MVFFPEVPGGGYFARHGGKELFLAAPNCLYGSVTQLTVHLPGQAGVLLPGLTSGRILLLETAPNFLGKPGRQGAPAGDLFLRNKAFNGVEKDILE